MIEVIASGIAKAARVLWLALSLAIAAPTAAVAADVFKGMMAYESGDYETALAEFRPLAEEGDAHAIYSLGRMYEEGHGVDKSYAEARKFYERGAQQFHQGSLHRLARMSLFGRGVKASYVEAYKWFNIAQIRGSKHAAAYMARMRKKMSREQVDVAQKRAINWLAEYNKNK